jgi:hypothetical protein
MLFSLNKICVLKIRVGVMKLDQGKGELVLRSTIMKGSQMMDVKSLSLKLNEIISKMMVICFL